ncbi:MAG: thioredoxin [Verrucomicrobiae bacterium]|nr:thioredoxin [Verrucomicrobiae bacterium]
MKTSAKFTAFFFVAAALLTSLSLVSAADTKPLALTKDNFATSTAKGVVLVDFWAEWCGPCKMIAPAIEELAKDYHGKAVIAKVDIDSNPELAQKYQIRAIPNLKILKDGKVVDEIVGLADKKEIEKKLKKHLR